ncbi:MAG: SRPBCC family protein, partial [Gordonia sp. (in: high G+C Gram-positive bacteria)]
ELGSSSRFVTGFSHPVSVPVFKTIEADTLRHFAHLTPQT